MRTAVRVQLLRVMVRSGSHLHEESITQISLGARRFCFFFFLSLSAFNRLLLQIDTTDCARVRLEIVVDSCSSTVALQLTFERRKRGGGGVSSKYFLSIALQIYKNLEFEAGDLLHT